jgi:hypothetical protein
LQGGEIVEVGERRSDLMSEGNAPLAVSVSVGRE